MEQIISNPVVFTALIIWSLAWKGLGLWRAAKNNQKYWFVAIMVINAVGILEIIYLGWFAKKDRFWERLLRR